MGRLVEGKWTTEWYEPDDKGRFVRPPTKFHDRVTRDGSSGFPGQAGRYHLYVSLACPWAHRAVIARKLKGLEDVISVSVLDPYMGDDGWAFSDAPGTIPDFVNGARFLREIYVKAVSDYTGRVTTPVLWDRERETIVNNESREIVRMLDTAFDDVGGDASVRLFPDDRAGEIEAMLDANYRPVNNGVYRAGFASSQAAHEEAVGELFERLAELERHLATNRFLCGERITGADWCLFPTLFRFDSVYAIHFKCARRRVVDLPNLWGYARELYQVPGIAETCDMRHIKQHYYRSHPMVNPSGLIPVGPDLDFDAPHGRDRPRSG